MFDIYKNKFVLVKYMGDGGVTSGRLGTAWGSQAMASSSTNNLGKIMGAKFTSVLSPICV